MSEQCVRPSQLKLEGGFEIEGEGLDALKGVCSISLTPTEQRFPTRINSHFVPD